MALRNGMRRQIHFGWEHAGTLCCTLTLYADPVLQVDNLVKHYGDVQAVRGLSFTVDEGEVFGLLGPNGAGKTTTVEILEGLRNPDSGTVAFAVSIRKSARAS